MTDHLQHLLFAKAGRDNTEKTLDLLEQATAHYRVNQVVIASTRGDTGLAAARKLQGKNINLVVVTHNSGFKEAGTLEMPAATRSEIEAHGRPGLHRHHALSYHRHRHS